MKLKIQNKNYTLFDFIKIPFFIAPGFSSLRIIDKLIYALIPSLQILLTAKFIDTAIAVFNSQSEKSRIYSPLIYIMLIIAYQYIGFALMGFVRARMDMRMTKEFRSAVIEKRASLEYLHIENNDTWDLINRVGGDPSGSVSNGLDTLIRMADMIVRVGSILIILLAQVWWAALIILAVSAPLFWLSIKSGKTNYNAWKEAEKHNRRAWYLQGVMTGRENVEERALFSYTNEINKRWYEKFITAYKINTKARKSQFIKMKGSSLITIVISVIIVGVLIVPLGSGTITIGMFMGLVTATFNLVQMMSWELTSITNQLSYSREYMKDLTEFSKLSENEGAADLPAVSVDEPECIEFINVSFCYPGTDVQILKNLSLTINAKQHYAFVGINGAGKTTLTKLLTGLYDNYTGDILIDGKNLRDYKQAELKTMFSVVYQDYAKYQIIMRDSIGIGNVHGTSDEIISEKIKIIGLDEAVEKLPDGINTPLGKIKDNGVDISGGEWQKVAIARSLVSNAFVHILDEPTAALDPVMESEIYKLFGQISKNKTTIFITHRLGAARLAKKIFVISDGCVKEQGSHDELLQKNGIYAEMFNSQRGWYI